MDSSYFGTGLASIPTGAFTDFARYEKASKAPKHVRSLPVLRGMFDANRFSFRPGLPSHIGWGHIALDDVDVLTIRIQVGASMLYWLANPTDAHVWEVLDKWAAAKNLLIAPEFQDGKAFVGSRDFKMPEQYAKLREQVTGDKRAAERFAAVVGKVIATGDLKWVATSDIPSVKQLTYVQACMVETAHTRAVPVSVQAQGKEAAVSAEGPVAEAVSELLRRLATTANPATVLH